MDFKRISDFFGGTIFADDYRCDFQDAEDRIEELESAITTKSPAEDRATVLLLRTVHSAMRGDLAAAESYLRELSSLVTNSLNETWKSRCKEYGFYLLSLKRVTPALQFRPDSTNQSAVLKDAVLQTYQNCELHIQHRKGSRLRRWSELEELESDVILYAAGFSGILWTNSFVFHPKYCANPLNSSCPWNTEPFPPELVDSAIRQGLVATARHFGSLEVQFHLGRMSDQSSLLLDGLQQKYKTEGDQVGIGNCELLRGDTTLSPPFTSPIALNLMSLDHNWGWYNMGWDPLEPSFSLQNNPEANGHYLAALESFKATGCKRGQAAVHLRRGCVAHAQALSALRSGHAEDSTSLLKSASDELEAASSLFQGDYIYTQIVKTHQLLLDISANNNAEISARASDIGNAGLQTKDISTAQFAGLLMLRLGRKHFLEYKSTEKALMCCACARACFNGLGDHFLELQALTAHAELLYVIGSLDVACAKICEGRRLFPGALQQLDMAIERAKGSGKSCTVQGLRNNARKSFDLAVAKIYGSNSSALQEWELERDRLCPDEDDLVGFLKNLMSRPTAFPRSRGMEGAPSNIDMSTVSVVVEKLKESQKDMEMLRNDYFESLAKSQRALQLFADVDRSEKHLQEFLDRSKRYATAGLALLHHFQLVTLSLLGRFEEARRILPRAVPISHGGQSVEELVIFPDNEGPLAILQRDRVKYLAERSVAQCFVTKHWQLGSTVLGKVKDVPGFLKPDEMSQNSDAWQLMVWVASIQKHNSELEAAFDWYLQAREILETQRSQTSDPDARRGSFATIHSGELFFGLAEIALRFAESENGQDSVRPLQRWKLPGPTWREQALLFLEQGRARALLDLLIAEEEVDTKTLQDWSATSYRVRLLAESLTLPSKVRDEAISEATSKLRIETTELSKIEMVLDKHHRGLASVLSSVSYIPDVKTLYGGIPANAVVLHINLSRDGLVVFCMMSDGIAHIHKSSTTDIDIRRTAVRYLEAIRSRKEETRLPLNQCAEAVKRLSEDIIEPFAHFIKAKHHIIFIPSHSLNKFPFAVLTLDNKPLFLRNAVSVVPSLSALQHLVSKQSPRREISVAVVANLGTGDQNAVEQPPPLAAIEAVNIARVFNCEPKDAGILNADSFEHPYQEHDLVHITTHGLQSGTSAWQSSITLQGQFRVLDLGRMRSKAALVVFAACVSGIRKDTTGNDVLGFSHAVLASGASAFVGGLWDVNDQVSMLIMLFFYKRLAKRETDASLADCWQRAQIELYELDKDRAIAALREARDVWNQAKGAAFISKEVWRKSKRNIDFAIEDLEGENVLDYKHPYFWAPFVLIGHGGLVL